MGKLCELVAKYGAVQKLIKARRDETKHTLKDKKDHFIGWTRTYSALSEEERSEVGETLNERKDLVTTVMEKLLYHFGHEIQHLDLAYQRDLANQTAKGDIKVGDLVLARDVPVTFLLALEDEIKHWRELINESGTIPPGIGVKLDKDMGEHIYVTENPEQTARTKKVVCSKVVAPPTDKHPAQVQVWNEDKPVGHFAKKSWFGLLTPKQKSDMLGRVDTLLQEVMAARHRANTSEAPNVKLGKSLVEYLLGQQVSEKQE